METKLRPDKINLNDLKAILKRYESHVPAQLLELEELRLHTIPDALKQRKEAGDAFLDKDELTKLVEWKLKHGTFRPNLAKLVASNPEAEVRTATSTAFTLYDTDPSDVSKPLAALTKLKGIGPATASLVLSCYDPAAVPFFADELYLYLHWEEGKARGWDRKIGYTVKEYKALVEKVKELRDRLEADDGDGAPAIDMEKVAYVLGKEAAAGKKGAKDVPGQAKPDKLNTKRKTEELSVPKQRKRRKG